jgi:hypothetical protein
LRALRVLGWYEGSIAGGSARAVRLRGTT